MFKHQFCFKRSHRFILLTEKILKKSFATQMLIVNCVSFCRITAWGFTQLLSNPSPFSFGKSLQKHLQIWWHYWPPLQFTHRYLMGFNNSLWSCLFWVVVMLKVKVLGRKSILQTIFCPRSTWCAVVARPCYCVMRLLSAPRFVSITNNLKLDLKMIKVFHINIKLLSG